MTKKWISGALKHPGREKRAAAKAGETTHEYMEKHKNAGGSEGAAANLGLRLEAMHGEGKKKTAARGGNKTPHHKVYSHLD